MLTKEKPILVRLEHALVGVEANLTIAKRHAINEQTSTALDRAMDDVRDAQNRLADFKDVMREFLDFNPLLHRRRG